MRRAMKAAEGLNMTKGDHAFIYVDLYNSNSSYFWTDDDDNLAADTSDPNDRINITSKFFEVNYLFIVFWFFVSFFVKETLHCSS